MTDSVLWLEYFMLMLMRISSMFIISPIFGRKNVPNMAKIVLSIMIAYILIPIYPPHEIHGAETFLGYSLLCLREVALGAIIGYVMLLFFSVVEIAGRIIDFELGTSMAQIYDSSSGTTMALSGSFLNIMLVVLFFLTDGHLKTIQLMSKSFETSPVGGIVFGTEFINIVINAFVTVFVIGIKIAMPIIAIGLMVEVLFGVLMKVIPQINFFSIGIPIKMTIGFIMLLAVVPIASSVMVDVFDQMYKTIDAVFSVVNKV